MLREVVLKALACSAPERFIEPKSREKVVALRIVVVSVQGVITMLRDVLDAQNEVIKEGRIDYRPSEEGTLQGSTAYVGTNLAQYPPGTLLSEESLANALKVSARTLRRMVARYELPPGIRLGGRKVWVVEKVREYLADRAERLAKEAARKDEQIRRGL